MVLSYESGGNLRDYLQQNHSKLTLKNRIMILRYLCQSLYYIHEKDLIHCDLHSGNILMEGNGCLITDLGLCGPVDEESSNKIYGIVSYIALEILQGKIESILTIIAILIVAVTAVIHHNKYTKHIH